MAVASRVCGRIFPLLLVALPVCDLRAQLTWADPFLPPPARDGHHAFYDEPRGRMTVYAGSENGTYLEDAWSFDGWAVIPAAKGPILGVRAYGAVASDPSFPGRAIVFGGRAPSGSLYDETLRWDDNGVLAKLSPAVSPPARWLTAMAHDTARRRVVLFGGNNLIGPLTDMWEWDGTTWSIVQPAMRPSGRANHAMAFDAARAQVVLFGGHSGVVSLGDTWTYDGGTWTNRSPGARPLPRHNHAMAFDARRNVVVLFGGKDDANIVFNDVWEWNGVAWNEVKTAMKPPARELCSLVYDAKRQVVTLYGGARDGAPFGDVWEWGGVAWGRRAPWIGPPPHESPSGRLGHASAFDIRRNRIVVFGGTDSTGTQGDLWENDFTRWMRRAPTGGPGPRAGAGMAYDPARRVTYLVGGRLGAKDVDTTLWSWDGQRWNSESAAVIPPRSSHACLFDTTRNRLIVFGGHEQAGNTCLHDTWEFVHGVGWNRLALTNAPPGRAGCAAFFRNGVLRVYGGLDENGVYLGDFWMWDGGTNWKAQTPAILPAARSDAAIVFDASRDLAIMFGGRALGVISGENWLWREDSGWVLPQHNFPPPSARMGATFTYDDFTGLCTLFGGLDETAGPRNDTWDVRTDSYFFNQRITRWWPMPMQVPIKPRSAQAAAYDHARGETVVFGGLDSEGFAAASLTRPVSHRLNDTVTWNGAEWTSKVVGMPPPHRSWAAMAFDASMNRVVLFGGNGSYSRLDDTWTWDGVDWRELAVTGPAQRGESAMVSLAPKPGVLLFGGTQGTVQFADTYRFQSEQWTAIPGPGPAGRYGHAMAYDRLRNKVVLFGGFDATGVGRTDTWEFEPGRDYWTERQPATSPPGRGQHVMAFDASRGRVVMLGGKSAINGSPCPFGEVWEWDGAKWMRPVVVRPRIALSTQVGPWMDSGILCYDERRARSVGFGGSYNVGFSFGFNSNQVTELWCPIDAAGQGMYGDSKPLLALSQPTIGGALKLWFENPMNAGALYLGLGPVQGPVGSLPPPIGCGAGGATYTDLRIGVPYGKHSPGSFALAIPYDPSLVARTLVFQGLSLNSTCFALTDALHAVFQRP